VVPVKPLDSAKSRLGDTREPTRAELALAFAIDCLTALVSASLVDRVLVVSSDPALHPVAGALGALWLDEAEAAGLNAAAAQGLASLDASGPVAVIVSDLPALTPAAIDLALTLASAEPMGFISDAAGTGTTMLMAAERSRCVPAFGVRSRARHRRAGYADLGLSLPASADLARARRDVDTAVDLADAIRLGVGPATARALRLD
jgi:2-phospho-L-lactate guanylyltransferase